MKIPVHILTALLVIGGGGALHLTGCAGTSTSKSAGEVIDDAAITTKVKTAFVRDPLVKAIDVKVDTFKGNVQLNGFVNTSEEKARAEVVARSVAGVASVQNNVTVKGQTYR